MVTEVSQYYSKYVFKLKNAQDHLNALMRRYNRWYNDAYMFYLEKELDGEPTGLAGVHVLMDLCTWRSKILAVEQRVNKLRQNK